MRVENLNHAQALNDGQNCQLQILREINFSKIANLYTVLNLQETDFTLNSEWKEKLLNFHTFENFKHTCVQHSYQILNSFQTIVTSRPSGQKGVGGIGFQKQPHPHSLQTLPLQFM